MAVNLEIEFKNLLDKTEYEKLLRYFSIDQSQVKTQKNIYFDTDRKDLKRSHSALRIRLKEAGFELTLKTKDPRGALELNQEITENQYLDLVRHGVLVAGEVADALNKLKINPQDVQVIADLTTRRVEFPYEEGTLFLDESLYGDVVDYEVEYEAADYTVGLETFKAFLSLHQIPVRPAEPKIRRAESVHRL